MNAFEVHIRLNSPRNNNTFCGACEFLLKIAALHLSSFSCESCCLCNWGIENEWLVKRKAQYTWKFSNHNAFYSFVSQFTGRIGMNVTEKYYFLFDSKLAAKKINKKERRNSKPRDSGWLKLGKIHMRTLYYIRAKWEKKNYIKREIRVKGIEIGNVNKVNFLLGTLFNYTGKIISQISTGLVLQNPSNWRESDEVNSVETLISTNTEFSCIHAYCRLQWNMQDTGAGDHCNVLVFINNMP